MRHDAALQPLIAGLPRSSPAEREARDLVAAAALRCLAFHMEDPVQCRRQVGALQAFCAAYPDSPRFAAELARGLASQIAACREDAEGRAEAIAGLLRLRAKHPLALIDQFLRGIAA